jgi:hypothetical protein
MREKEAGKRNKSTHTHAHARPTITHHIYLIVAQRESNSETKTSAEKSRRDTLACGGFEACPGYIVIDLQRTA